MVTRLASLTVALLTGCSLITDSFVTNDFSGDPFPIDVDTASGGILVGVRQSGARDRVGVIDILSPITVVDPGPMTDPSISYADLVILGAAADGSLTIPRGRLPNAKLVALHPCIDDECTIGPTASASPYQAIVGADALAGDAVRLRLADDQLFLLADVAGDVAHRTIACDAVFGSPYRGGGTLVIGGTELPFGSRRLTLQSCLAPDPDPAKPQSARGTDVLLIGSTGVGISMLGASAYERYRRNLGDVPPALDTLPMDSVNLASGPVAGRRTSIPSLALVAASSSHPRAPCRQVYAHHLLTPRDCVDGDDCPCENGDTLCGIPSLVEVAPSSGIDVLVIADDEPTLQALRTELRPDQPEVDGILGIDAMRELELDIDYPHNRLLARCTGTAVTCQTRPQLYESADRAHILECLGGLPGPIPRTPR